MVKYSKTRSVEMIQWYDSIETDIILLYNKNVATYNKIGGIEMIDNIYKSKISAIISKAKKKGLITTYKEFSKTDLANETKLSDDEIDFYTSMKEGVESDEEEKI